LYFWPRDKEGKLIPEYQDRAGPASAEEVYRERMRQWGLKNWRIGELWRKWLKEQEAQSDGNGGSGW
jgi:hypothetical protein